MDTRISLVQLIKSGDISVSLEISRVQAKKDIHVYVRQYLNQSPEYKDIKREIEKAENALQQASDENFAFFSTHLEHLRKVEKDFIINALLLGKLFSEIPIRTERLRKALQLFEEGKIKEADAILKTDELLNDQFALILIVEYKEAKLKLLQHDS